jgi:hypothetical protein
MRVSPLGMATFVKRVARQESILPSAGSAPDMGIPRKFGVAVSHCKIEINILAVAG